MELSHFHQEPIFVRLRLPYSMAATIAGENLQAQWNTRNGAVMSADKLLSDHVSFRSSHEAVATIEKEKSSVSWSDASLDDALTCLDAELLPWPTVSDLFCILRKCRKAQNSCAFSRLFVHIRALGHDADARLGNDLVCMLAEAGRLEEAQQVFDKLRDRKQSCYNALITGYVKWGQPLLALDLFERMRPDEMLHLSGHNFVALIKACTKSKNMKLGSQIHESVATRGLLKKDRFLGSALVDMYAKCGSLTKAKDLFDELPVRDVVLWNALISAYASHGLGEKALNSFRQMQHEGFKPTAITLVSCLKACGSLGDAHQGQILDAEVTQQGLVEKDLIVGCALMDMHVKCGFLEKAEEVFHKLPVRNVVSWTSLIKGYVEHGFAEKALSCFEKMQAENIFPDAIAFLYGLKACGHLGDLVKGHKIHADISRRGLENDLILSCTLVDMYCKFGFLNLAKEVFNKLETKDVALWNTLMGGFIDLERGEEALQLYEQMRRDGICPVAVSYVFALKACGTVMNIQKGREIHSDIFNNRLDRDLLVGSSLVDMYAKCGVLEAAQEVFDNLSDYDVVSWTSLIGGYTDCGRGEEALALFEQMQYEGLTPNAVTFACSLKACGNEGTLDKGQEIHAKITKAGLMEEESILGNALIDMYAKCGLPARAQEMFEMQVVQDVVSWNALIAGYAQLGKSEPVICTLEMMTEGDQTPNVVTFVSVLNACSHAGLIDLGLMYLQCMVQNYGIIPKLEHLTCLVDLLCRAGQIENALSVINKMQIDPDLAVWHTFLGACRVGSSMNLGKQAFDQAALKTGLDATAYVSLSNIFYDNDDMG